jgi:hypothetical protein
LIGESTSPSRADGALHTSPGEKILSSARMSVEWRPAINQLPSGQIFDGENIFQNMDLCLESSLAGQRVEGLLPVAFVAASGPILKFASHRSRHFCEC